MSNTIRFDSLLVRDLAAELNARLSGERLRALDFAREVRQVSLRMQTLTLVFDLTPSRGGIARGVPSREAGSVPVARGSTLGSVRAPADERVIEFAVTSPNGPSGSAHAVVIELVTNRWNAFALGAERRVLAALRWGASAARGMAPGDVYIAPRLSVRRGVREPIDLEEWLRLLIPSPPRERRRRVLESLANTSPLNVDAILGAAAETNEPHALRDAHARYARIVGESDRDPCLLDPDGMAQPYPVRVAEPATPMPGLLEAFEAALLRAGRPAPAAPGTLAEEALDRVLGRIRLMDRRIERLRVELDGAPADAALARKRADLLMSQLHRIPRGQAFADLEDFDGGRVRITLDPAVSPAENATRLYDVARKRDRAASRLPRLVRRAEAERSSLETLRDRIRQGEITADALEEILRQDPAAEPGKPRPGPSLPYRRYQTTGGLEVRVGRGPAPNDDLTFHHSSPDDIWLHARDTAGAHVILRWPSRDANPPARDLEEAAVLAALHSRARTAGTVPVDWTRRKYVRKPRKAPPGRVTFERGRTLFVQPDPDVEQRLRQRHGLVDERADKGA